jgi:hypothetical protein
MVAATMTDLAFGMGGIGGTAERSVEDFPPLEEEVRVEATSDVEFERDRRPERVRAKLLGGVEVVGEKLEAVFGKEGRRFAGE